MSKFNSSVKTVATPGSINKAGGQAYSQSIKLELASLLLTSFTNDSYYEKSQDRFLRLDELIAKDPYFAAKAMIYARNEFGMRSITHVGATVIAKHLAGLQWGKEFYNMIVRRPDDMTEILACYLAYNKGQRKLPNALRKGFAKAFSRFDSYSLSKYRGEGKIVKLVDVVNLVHPTPCERNAEALKGLVEDTLRSTETWEAKLTEAGQTAQNAAQLASNKAAVWSQLLSERKLPYFALLRNLRNICEQGEDTAIQLACESLVNTEAIKKSLVLPFRYISALKELHKIGTVKSRKLIVAVDSAINIALDNMPAFSGDNLVVLDCSGSMWGTQNPNPIEIGSLFAAAISKKTNSDCIVFGDRASYINPKLTDSLTSIAGYLGSNNLGGTDYRSWINCMNKKYDRIFVLSDGEAWGGWKVAEGYMKLYRTKYKANPHVFNFDLAGNGTMQFPENRTYCIAGFSDKTMDLVAMLEEDKTALVTKIEATPLNY